MRNIATKVDDVGDTLPAAAFNSDQNEFENMVTSAGLTLDPDGGPDTDLTMLSKAATVYGSAGEVYIDSGTANAYVLSHPGSLAEIPSYQDGLRFTFKAGFSNTGASTVNVASKGVKNLKMPDGTALPAGKILAGSYYTVVYRSTGDECHLLGSDPVNYFVDPAATDQGVVTSQGLRSLKDWTTTIGTTKNATVVFRHTGAANTTEYDFDTSLNLSSYTNIIFVVENGARFTRNTGDEVLTFPAPENVIAGKRQQLTAVDMLAFADGGFVYPHWWGAKGDGSTNDANAFNYAMGTSRSIYVPGTDQYYKITSAIVFNEEGQAVVGEGYRSYIRTDTTNINIFTASAKNRILIEGLRLRGAGSSTGDYLGCGIILVGCDDVKINRMWIANTQSGIVGHSGCDRSLITNIHFTEVGTQYGVYYLDCTNLEVSNVLFQGNAGGQEAVQINSSDSGVTKNYNVKLTNIIADFNDSTANSCIGASLRYCLNSSISDCIVRLPSTGSASMMGVSANNSDGVTITGNYITGGQAADVPNGSEGINIGDGTTNFTCVGNTLKACTKGIRAGGVTDGVITGNLIIDTKDGAAIFVDQGTLNDVNITISGNTALDTSGAAAIKIQLVRFVDVVGNTIRNAEGAGIQLIDSEQVNVSACHIYNCDGSGISVNNTSDYNISGCRCIDNNTDSDASKDGITVLSGSSDGHIHGNTCNNGGAASGDQKYGIGIRNASLTNIFVHDNIVSGNTTGGIYSQSTIKVRDNIGFATENSGTGTITNGTTSVNVTHGLDKTPTAADLLLTPTLFSDAAKMWIDATTITSTQFTVKVNTDPGVNNATFGWQARMLTYVP